MCFFMADDCYNSLKHQCRHARQVPSIARPSPGPHPDQTLQLADRTDLPAMDPPLHSLPRRQPTQSFEQIYAKFHISSSRPLLLPQLMIRSLYSLSFSICEAKFISVDIVDSSKWAFPRPGRAVETPSRGNRRAR